jgi:hypothetical protein
MTILLAASSSINNPPAPPYFLPAPETTGVPAALLHSKNGPSYITTS